MSPKWKLKLLITFCCHHCLATGSLQLWELKKTRAKVSNGLLTGDESGCPLGWQEGIQMAPSSACADAAEQGSPKLSPLGLPVLAPASPSSGAQGWFGSHEQDLGHLLSLLSSQHMYTLKKIHSYKLSTYIEGNGTPLQYPAWKIPWMEEPGGLQSMGSLRVGHD